MPGFRVGTNNSELNRLNPAPSTTDFLRSHRYKLLKFFDIATDNRQGFLAVKDISLPDKKVKSTSVKTIGTEYKFASQASYTDLKMNFYGTKNLLTALEEYADQPHNLAEGIGDFNTYKGAIEFVIFSEPDRTDGVKYVYQNAFVSEVTHGQVSYGTSDIKDIGVTIEFDFYEVFKISGGLVLDRQTKGTVSSGDD